MMSNKARFVFDKDYVISKIDNRIYGSFVENLGRCVYGGLYDPEDPTADSDGFRQDVIDAVNELNVPMIRLPGGNFVATYVWEDGVGPRDTRPRKPDLAWKCIETNQIGTNEYMDWLNKVGAEAMMTVNVGTRGILDALNLLDYCNRESGTYYSDLRVSHGYKKPHRIKTWAIGNELDGVWQVGQQTPFEYARVARETAKAMKRQDGSIQVVAAGSAGQEYPTFGEWEQTLIQEAHPFIDYLSLHQYYLNVEQDTANFLAKTLAFDDYIKSIGSLIDYMKVKNKSKNDIHISLDEWNVWYHTRKDDMASIRDRGEDWPIAPKLLEEPYNFEDALVAGAMLIALLRNSDRVKIAAYAQLVNVLAPIMTDKNGQLWKNTIFYPIYYTSKYGRGTAIQGVIESPKYDSRDFTDVPLLDAVAVLNEDETELTVFAINKSLKERLDIQCDFRSFGQLDMIQHIALENSDVYAVNTLADPKRVLPTEKERAKEAGQLSLEPLSWNMLRYRIK
ncbi:alpha-N-arabinofuranosidase [Paenibacillus donghaensis]|uniref:non-reducing end alpha-L-arabinofuranosidase n=2 Tax=Paenibacillus donghaensis TaxID=414771 RepID=A0A2Z2KCT8_9BACL|nr:alpha-N-arabinofuranosidase [Paenibacillus donghaensis]